MVTLLLKWHCKSDATWPGCSHKGEEFVSLTFFDWRAQSEVDKGASTGHSPPPGHGRTMPGMSAMCFYFCHTYVWPPIWSESISLIPGLCSSPSWNNTLLSPCSALRRVTVHNWPGRAFIRLQVRKHRWTWRGTGRKKKKLFLIFFFLIWIVYG